MLLSFRKEKLNQFLLLSLISLVVLILFNDILFNLNSKLILERSGDSIKNYYSFINHVKNDASFFDSSNYNYPYGENITFSDSTPLFSTITKLLNSLFPISDYLIGIFNLLIILSIIFSSWVIYKLSRLYGIYPFLAILLSIGIAMLSPQYVRIQGHYSLFYSFPIPLTWLLTFQFIKTNKGKYAILNAVTLWLAYYLHPYMGLISNTLSGITIAVYFLFKSNLIRKNLLWIILQTLVPIFLFLIINSLVDTHLNRPNFSWGSLISEQRFENFFSSKYTLLSPYYALKGHSLNTQAEGYLYLGWYSILGALTLLTTWGYKVYKNKFKSINFNLFNISLMLSVLILLYFSFGLPGLDLKTIIFKYPIVSQFRAISRFSFPLFYFVLILITILLNKWIQENERFQKAKSIFVIFLLSILIIEGFYIAKNLTKSKENTFVQKAYDDQILNKKYQAIIPLPLNFSGGTRITKIGGINAIDESFRLSYIYNIPLMGTFTSRTSLNETKSIIEAFHFYDKKPIPLLSDDPFLIILDHSSPLNEDEEYLIKNSTLIKKDKKLSYFYISSEMFNRKNNKSIAKEISDIELMIDSKKPVSKDSSDFIFFLNFDENDTKTNFLGEGSFERYCDKRYNICKLNSLNFSSEKYVMSYWINKKYLTQLYTSVIISKENSETKKTSRMFANSTRAFYFDNDWYLIEKEFKIEKSKFIEYSFIFNNNIYNTDTTLYIMDNFMLRPKGSKTYLFDNEKDRFLINNKPYNALGKNSDFKTVK